MFCGDVRVEERLQLTTAGEEHVQTHEDLVSLEESWEIPVWKSYGNGSFMGKSCRNPIEIVILWENPIEIL